MLYWLDAETTSTKYQKRFTIGRISRKKIKENGGVKYEETGYPYEDQESL